MTKKYPEIVKIIVISMRIATFAEWNDFFIILLIPGGGECGKSTIVKQMK